MSVETYLQPGPNYFYSTLLLDEMLVTVRLLETHLMNGIDKSRFIRMAGSKHQKYPLRINRRPSSHRLGLPQNINRISLSFAANPVQPFSTYDGCAVVFLKIC